MFSNTFQSGFISIFYSIGSSPLALWDKAVKNGHIRRIIDDEVKSLVLEVSGTNVATTYITCPIKPRASLGIKLPFLVMVVKNLKKYFTFEIQILDDKDMRRRFRVSNFQSTTKVRPFCTTMPIGLSSGWNQIQFNLADFTRRAYGTVYMETVRVQVHANVRIRRIYFSDRLYSEDELPSEYKLFLPITAKKDKHAPQKTTEKGPEKVAVTKATEVEADTKVQDIEREIPSGAPPTPTELEHGEEGVAPEEDVLPATSVAAAGDIADVAELVDEAEEGQFEEGAAVAEMDEGEAEGGEAIFEEVVGQDDGESVIDSPVEEEGQESEAAEN